MSTRSKEPIAIIGMSCRFPGAGDLSSFWRLLRDGQDALTAPAGRRFSQPPAEIWDLPGGGVGGLLQDVDCFDSEFFGIAPFEAARMDPQQRLLLETAWEALEDAGFTREAVAGARAGVFTGIWAGDFENTLYASATEQDLHMITGTGRFPGPNRISYVFDLRGPSLTVDTACSSSLVAVHLACQSIWSGESEFALAGGVNAILRPEITEAFAKANMMAADRRCKFGDAAADGFVRSEGAGMIVLKALSKARRDGDSIYAIIRGSAVNNDGQGSGSILHPSRGGQEALLREACRDAGVSPTQLQYAEAHGTGTSAGDPVEIDALGCVFGDRSERASPCLIGSVKTNIGHTEGAAGVAGLIKVALSMWRRVIPASLHFRQPTPNVCWERYFLGVPTSTTPWPASDGPRMAGVSAFGITGTNAHVVLEGAPEDCVRPMKETAETGKAYLLPLSAKRPEALQALAQSYLRELRSTGGLPSNIGDVAFTTALRRTSHDERLAVIARNRAELAESLEAFSSGEPRPGMSSGRANNSTSKVAFVFPGQGGQWTGMGRKLFAQEPVFREEIERCDQAMKRLVDWSLLDLFTGTGPLPDRINIIQPALFAVSAALAKLWLHWGVKPAAMVGHSMGEVAAAYVSGALSLADAAAVICHRSRLMDRVRGQGSMALVDLPMETVQARLKGYAGVLSIAASNSASSTVLSGQTEALQELLSELEGEQVFCRLIKVDVASHSAYVDPIREDLLRELKSVRPRQGSIPIYSTVTSTVTYGEGLDARYWVRNLREPVMFRGAVAQLIRDGFGTFIEVSPHPLLIASIQTGFAEFGREGLALPSLKREEDERETLFSTAGALYVAGYRLNWTSLSGSGRCVSLPSYPFQREHAWLEASPTAVRKRDKGHPFLSNRVDSSLDRSSCYWDMNIGTADAPFLSDHKIRGMIVLPGAAYLEIALSAAKEIGPGPHRLEDVAFKNPLVLLEGASRPVQLAFGPVSQNSRPFRFSSRESDGSWTELASGTLRSGESPEAARVDIDAIRERCHDEVFGEDRYRRLAAQRLEYGPAFQLVDRAWRNREESLARIRQEGVRTGAYLLDPAVFDAALQSVAELFPQGRPFLSVGAGKVRVLQAPAPSEDLYAHATLRNQKLESGYASVCADVTLLDSKGNIVLEVAGFVCRGLDRTETGERCLHAMDWIADAAAVGAPNGRGRWLILADRQGVASRLRDSLLPLGQESVLAFAGERFDSSSEPGYVLDPEWADDYTRLLAEVGPCQGVLHLWGLDVTMPADATPDSLDASQKLGAKSLVLLVQALAQSNWPQPPRLWLATAGLHAAAGGTTTSCAQGPLWGLGRVIVCEHPELRCALIDLSPEPGTNEIAALAHTLSSESREDQITLRGGRRFVARYRDIHPDRRGVIPTRAGSQAFRAVLVEPGNVDSLALEACRKVQPGPGEVELEIEAAGLNFLDVLKALGSYPGVEPGPQTPLGGECCGRVSRVGAGVEGIRPGDCVVAIQPTVLKPGLLASHAILPVQAVVKKPSNLTAEGAASVPLVFLTAWYALHRLARIRPGERVLIHAGAGGVGLAAIQLAQRAGATVFATAGSPEKRKFLEQLGVAGVFDSRSTAFAAQVLEATGSDGVDIVLNSLAGEFLTAGLSTLRPHGRFVEIGKRDIYEHSPLDLYPFRKNLSFFALDLAAVAQERPDELADSLRLIMQQFEEGSLRPLPVREFPASQIAEAFRHMMEARHIGKVVVTFREKSLPIRSGVPEFDPQAGYLITGGLGGIGLEVAHWMAQNGAGYLVLAGRREPSEEARVAIGKIQALGARVRTVSADVGKPEDVARLVACFGNGSPELRGIMHAAAVLDDDLVVNLDPARFRGVMEPKAFGAWYLHRQTQSLNLDFFVMFSSIASVLPQPGQPTYAAANAFLDALARYRRAQGQAGLAVNWGVWSNTGLALSNGASRSIRAWTAGGYMEMSPAQALDALGVAMTDGLTNVLAVPVDWRTAASYYTADSMPPVLSDLIQRQTSSADMAEGGVPLAESLRAAPSAERREILEGHLAMELSRVLRLAVNRIGRDTRLGAMGMDSLMAVAFVRRLSSSIGIRLPATAAFNYPTVTALATHVAKLLRLDVGEPVESPREPAAAQMPAVDRSIEDLTDEQAIEALLPKEVRA